MSQILSEDKIAALKAAGVRFPDVNETCIGCSACTVVSGEVFEMNDEGHSEVIEMDSYEDKMVDEAITACPVDAISWKE